MSRRGTVLRVTPSIEREFHSAVIAQLPDLTDEEMQYYNRNKKELGRRLRKAFVPDSKTSKNAPVGDDEWFELVVDHDRIDPMDIVLASGQVPKPDSSLAGWRYLGPKFSGRQIYRVKLIHLGYVKGVAAAQQRADAMGYRLLEGQARELFWANSPESSGHDGSVVFGGSQWLEPQGYHRRKGYVACLEKTRKGGWDSAFHSSEGEFDESCQWAVVSK